MEDASIALMNRVEWQLKGAEPALTALLCLDYHGSRRTAWRQATLQLRSLDAERADYPLDRDPYAGRG